MQRRNKGLTAIYNQVNDPDSDWSEVSEIREMHEVMDRAVLGSYGWSDIKPHGEFFPEIDDEDEEADDNCLPRIKKFRYRWPEETRDKVLARLLELNRQRALEEGGLATEALVFAGAPDVEPKSKGSRRKLAGARARISTCAFCRRRKRRLEAWQTR